MFGFLNIYKPKGITSHDVVAILRRVTKIKQIGHTGTLDPFAEGVLPICIGKATRLIEYLDDEKAYIGTIQLGKATTTYDIEGEVTNSSEKKVNIEDLKVILPKFKGELEQFPPIYSAIKVNGKKLYEYAREGKKVEIKPRKVNIEKISIEHFNEQNQQVKIYVECSKGTYIRSLANDIGNELGTYGHLIKLERVKAGSFLIEEALPIEKLNTKESVEKFLINPLSKFNYPQYELSEVEKDKVSHGMSIKINIKDGFTILKFKDNIAAIALVKNNLANICKVFI